MVGVFPGPKFDDAEGADQGEADVELLGWEDGLALGLLVASWALWGLRWAPGVRREPVLPSG